MAYVPSHSFDAKGALVPVRTGTFLVRAAGGNPLALASVVRQEVPNVRSGFRVSNISTLEFDSLGPDRVNRAAWLR